MLMSPFIICEKTWGFGSFTHAWFLGRYMVTSVKVRLQSAASGHIAIMWLQCFAATVLIAAAASREVFTNSFLVRFKKSLGHEEAHEVALRHGFENLGPVRGHVIIRKHKHRPIIFTSVIWFRVEIAKCATYGLSNSRFNLFLCG